MSKSNALARGLGAIDALESETPDLLGFVVERESTRLSDVLADLLSELGVTTAFGVVGGGIAPMTDALNRSQIRVIPGFNVRIENAAYHALRKLAMERGRKLADVAQDVIEMSNLLL